MKLSNGFLAEFFVDHIETHETSKRVVGKVYVGVVHLGQIFNYVYESSNLSSSAEIADELDRNERQIYLKIEKIEAYYNSTDLLENGTSGILQLSGSGLDCIKSEDILVTVQQVAPSSMHMIPTAN